MPEAVAATVDLKDIEIFAVGNWNGDDYSEADLDEIVRAHGELATTLKPYIKLGHDPKQYLLQKDGWPAGGWICNLRRVGDRLISDIKAVPRKIAELIERKAYGRLSAEIYWNLKQGETTYPRALKAVALLGGDTPAVRSLSDWINLYGSAEAAHAYGLDESLVGGDVRTADTLTDKEANMADELKDKTIAELTAKVAQFEEAAKAREAEVKAQAEADARSTAEALKAEKDARAKAEADVKAYSEKLAKVEADNKAAAEKSARAAFVAEVESVIADGVKAGKMYPVQVHTYRAMLLGGEANAEGLKVYSYKDGEADQKIEWKSEIDLFKHLIEVTPKLAEFSETTKHTEVKAGDKDAQAEISAKATAYVEEQAAKGVKVTFSKAVRIVAPRREK